MGGQYIVKLYGYNTALPETGNYFLSRLLVLKVKYLVHKFLSIQYTIIKICIMNTQNQVDFITGKIQQLQTAILHSNSDCLLKFPDSLAKTLQVDEVGCVWIVVKKPLQFLHEFDRSFHVRLNYYRKGTPFFLNISGMARLVIDPEETNQLSPLLRNECTDENLLLCIRILQANYFENQPRIKQTTFKRWKQSIASLFTVDNNYHHFNITDNKNYA
jgi:hypothetical protein